MCGFGLHNPWVADSKTQSPQLPSWIVAPPPPPGPPRLRAVGFTATRCSHLATCLWLVPLMNRGFSLTEALLPVARFGHRRKGMGLPLTLSLLVLQPQSHVLLPTKWRVAPWMQCQSGWRSLDPTWVRLMGVR